VCNPREGSVSERWQESAARGGSREETAAEGGDGEVPVRQHGSTLRGSAFGRCLLHSFFH